jgi:N-acetylated-alpha-linked acidic dipeptidase
VNRYLDELEQEIKNRKVDVDLSGVRAANARMGATAVALNAEVERILAGKGGMGKGKGDDFARLNDQIVKVEQAFLSEEGLPRRPWFRHQLYAPGFYTGYGVKTLPGVREALENNDATEARRMAQVLASALDRAREALALGVATAASIR